jgi:hypothetical protein
MKERDNLAILAHPGQEITEQELQHIVLTVAAAVLNPGE